MQISLDVRLEDMDAPPEPVTLVVGEPSPAPVAPSDVLKAIYRTASIRDELIAAQAEAPRPLLYRLSAVQRQYNALTAKPVTVCCGQTIAIDAPCPRCGPQKPETD